MNKSYHEKYNHYNTKSLEGRPKTSHEACIRSGTEKNRIVSHNGSPNLLIYDKKPKMQPSLLIWLGKVYLKSTVGLPSNTISMITKIPPLHKPEGVNKISAQTNKKFHFHRVNINCQRCWTVSNFNKRNTKQTFQQDKYQESFLKILFSTLMSHHM